MMAYNYYPNSYNPVYPQYQAPNAPYTGDYGRGYTNPQPNQNGSQNAIIWVSGEAGAKAYPVAPNQTIPLWDSEGQVIYIKSADMSGMPSIKTLDYVIRDESKKNTVFEKIDTSSFVTHEELDKRLAEIVSRGTAEVKHE